MKKPTTVAIDLDLVQFFDYDGLNTDNNHVRYKRYEFGFEKVVIDTVLKDSQIIVNLDNHDNQVFVEYFTGEECDAMLEIQSPAIPLPINVKRDYYTDNITLIDIIKTEPDSAETVPLTDGSNLTKRGRSEY